MLVVPNHWGDAPIVPARRSPARLRDWADPGVEIFLHGFFHRDRSRHRTASDRLRARFMTAGEGEFLGLHAKPPRDASVEGKALLEDVIGRAIDGFVAPAWLYGDGAQAALGRARDPDRRRSFPSLVAGERRSARARPGDHLGEPFAPASPRRSLAGRGASPCAAHGAARRRPSSRLSSSGARAQHREDVAGGNSGDVARAAIRTFCPR